MQNLTIDSLAFITELDEAVANHLNWTRRILRFALLQQPAEEDILNPLAHEMCRFGIWFTQNKSSFEKADLHNTYAVLSMHRIMHTAIRTMCICLMEHKTCEPADLEIFEYSQTELIRLLANFKTTLLQQLTQLDPLTTLPMRHGIEADFNLIRKVSLRSGLSIYIALIDVDHFKNINDTYGHHIGDLALRHIANTLKQFKREGEMLYRYGGEEFLMFMHSESSYEIKLATQRLVDIMRSSPLQISADSALTITISVGVTAVGANEDLTSAIHRADEALYQAKNGGRNRYVFS